MKLIAPVLLLLLLHPLPLSAGDEPLPLYPATVAEQPAGPSPRVMEDGAQIVVGRYEEKNAWVLIPVTVENGEPRNYRKDQWGKGNQLAVDSTDFPTLARTGLHSEAELSATKTITGIPMAAVTAVGRPEGSSWAGFLGRDETIIGVLTRDNRLVRKMGLTHPDLARVLFHVWNIVQRHDERMRELGKPLPIIDWFLYNGNRIRFLDTTSGKGWQESIFDDGNLGMYHLFFNRDLGPEEKEFLRRRYARLNPEQLDLLIERLTVIRTGEMVPYYIQRYGFYEGDTAYRADPLALAFIFGLRDINELDTAFEGKLFEVLTGNAAAPQGHGDRPTSDIE